MNTMFSVKNKTALVTGSTGGLGYAFAKCLAQHGAHVIINGRNQQRIDDAIKKLNNEGLSVSGVVFDVTNRQQVAEAAEKIQAEKGGVDILVNNAGVNLRNPLHDFSDEDWDKVIGINLTGTYNVSKAFVKGMIEKKSGKIINIGSMQSELGRPTIAPYAASKGGVKMLTRGMAVEWAKFNIQANGIGPGYFKTELTRPLYENPEFDAWLCSRTPSDRWGDVEELLGALIFLSSHASSYVNGQMIYVDGGLLASV